MRQVTQPPSCSSLAPHSGQYLASFAWAGVIACGAALAGTGIAGIAVVSALFAAKDTRRAAEELSALARKAVDA